MSAPLKVGLILPMFSGDPEKVLSAATDSEALGYDGVFAFDHFFPPGAPRDRPSLEAFTMLAAVAASTERVRVGTLVTRAVLRPAGLLAKMTATIHQVSNGRMVLGIGTGDPIDRPEHEAYGFPTLGVPQRRAHLAETVHALRCLFDGQPYVGGDLVPPMDGPLLPPVADAPPAIWLGAQADQVVRLAARAADGWNGWGMDPAAFARKSRLLQEEAAAAGRAAEATWAGIVLLGENQEEAERLLTQRREKNLEDVAWSGTVDGFVGFLEELAAAGASWAILVLAGPPGRRELLADRLFASARAAAQ